MLYDCHAKSCDDNSKRSFSFKSPNQTKTLAFTTPTLAATSPNTIMSMTCNGSCTGSDPKPRSPPTPPTAIMYMTCDGSCSTQPPPGAAVGECCSASCSGETRPTACARAVPVFKAGAFLDMSTFAKIADKVAFEEKWSDSYKVGVTSEYERFLFLHAAYPGSEIVPSKCVDLLWHGHILNTREYFKDCERMFGSYLHHNPSYGLSEKKALVPAFAKMQSNYEQLFSMKMDPTIWPQSVVAAETTVVSCGSGACDGSCSGAGTKPAAVIVSCGSGACDGSCSALPAAAAETKSFAAGGAVVAVETVSCGSGACGSGACSGGSTTQPAAELVSCGSGACDGSCSGGSKP